MIRYFIVIVFAIALFVGCIWYGKILYPEVSSCERLMRYVEIDSEWSERECKRQFMLSGLRYID